MAITEKPVFAELPSFEELKEDAFRRGREHNGREQDYLEKTAYVNSAGTRFHAARRAKMDEYILARCTIQITPGEKLVGRFPEGIEFTPEQKEERDIAGKAKHAERYDMYYLSATGHRVIDYETLINTGAKSRIQYAEEKLAALDFSEADHAEKAVFYKSVLRSLKAFCAFGQRYHEELLRLAEQESNPAQKELYLKIAKNFEKAPYEPCTSFYEALQIVWFTQYTLGILRDTTLAGRPDSYLWHFYVHDLAAGILTKEEAYELILHYYLKHNELHDTWPASLMLGGVNKQGETVCNELTELFLRGIAGTGLINPSVSLAYTPDMPQHILDLSVDLISKGYTKPSIFNDAVVRSGLERAGVSPEDATNYIHSTCVEITPIGASNILVATPYMNPCKSLEYIFGKGKALFGGEDCGLEENVPLPETPPATFVEFYNLTKQVFAQIIRKGIMGNVWQALERKQRGSAPLSSAFIHDCLEKGIDSAAGGAKYNFIYPCFPGYVTLVDSLAAIKTAVYDEKTLSYEELAQACASDFANEEDVRQYLVNRCEKFGNGLADVDSIGKDLFDFIDAELAKYKHAVEPCATFHPSYFAWIMHGELGKYAAATPNGRFAGEALSENLGASQGCDHHSPLGIVRSISKLEQNRGIGGIATNFRFSKNFIADTEGKAALANFIRSFMDSGCFECQFNVVDQATLLAAKANPKDYATLMVRVAGYSDYFTNLSPVLQDEILKRTEHDEL